MVPPPPPLEPPPEREGLLDPESQLREGRPSFSLLIILEFVRVRRCALTWQEWTGRCCMKNSAMGWNQVVLAGFRIIRGALAR